MRFYIGKFVRSDNADYDTYEDQFMRDQLGESLIGDMLKYSNRAWKTYVDNKTDYYLYVEVYCEIDVEKHATWFQLKYPSVKPVNTDFAQN